LIKKIIIAIDGYSSTGKSTLAHMLSKHLDYKHINTGSMYRALTLYAIRHKWINTSDGTIIDKKMIVNAIDSIKFNFYSDENKNYQIYMNGENVEAEIKNPIVSKYVSKISTYSMVRKKIVKRQQEIGRLKGVVIEGRDIGSVVFPDAELKLFITASSEVRAKRRHKELLSLGIKSTFKDVLYNLKMRDFSDSNRENSPLLCVKDAVLIDNTSLDIDQQFNLVIDMLRKKLNIS